MTQKSHILILIQVSKNEFLMDIFENMEGVSKMFRSEISKSKISDQKAQKMTIL